MNQKDFKRYMQQGLGRCILTLQDTKNIEKFKKTVLWGCLHDLSFDPQCEGSRAAYIYELTTFFHDEEYFVLPTVEAFAHIPRHSDWLFSHFCELLRCFAENQNETAKKALQKKYEQLFSTLLKKRRCNGYDFERDNLAHLCLALTSLGGPDALLTIASDLGRLFTENPRYDGSDFDWIFASMADQYGEKHLQALLRHASKESESILCFYQQYQKVKQVPQRTKQGSVDTPGVESIMTEVASLGRVSPRSRILFSRHADKKEKQELAENVIKETDLDKKAELLSVFHHESFPLSHEAIITYAQSSHERLKEVALDVLTNCQSPIVREYALSLYNSKTDLSHGLKMLLSNYQPEDKERLLSALDRLKVDYKEESDWHSIGLKILHVGDQNVKLPKEFFLYIYHTTLCSSCREYAIKALAKRRWLTEDIIRECRYDSSDTIRNYINRYYPKA